jgi:hypothetical protein
MIYPSVYDITFEPNKVLLNYRGDGSPQSVRLDMNEANALIDELIQATRSALNRGAHDAAREASKKGVVRSNVSLEVADGRAS